MAGDQRALDEAKRRLRAPMREAMRAVDPGVRRVWSEATMAWFEGSELWERASCVLGFLPGGDEPDCEPVLSELARAGKRVVVPRMDWESGEMRAHRLPEAWEVEVRRHGIREPVERLATVEAGEIDLVFVPGVAFDRAGGRLGRGAGFYDRFLARVRPGTPVIGACFAAQVVERVPMGPDDRRVSALATEHGRVDCA